MRLAPQSKLERIVIASGLVMPVILLLLAACGHKPPAPPAGPVRMAEVRNEFMGNAACAVCHQAEFKAHLHSRHDLALRPMDRQNLGSQAPKPGPIGDSGYTLTAEGDGFGFGRADSTSHALQLVFGSGKSGMAFASVPMNGVLAEARMSYYPPQKKWFITPGQQSISARTLGNVTQGEPARQCLGCHTVTLPADALMPEKKFMGVGCESCHGAGGTHVAAMRAGDRSHLNMEKLGSAGGARMTELCGRCHRTEHDVESKSLGREHTDLFQAHGLSQSACFKASGDKLTCITCHDPHTNASTDERAYVAACLKCHAGPKAGSVTRLVRAKACPVNPTDKCTGCHMPKKNEALFPGQPRTVADHFIRVHR